MQNLLDYYCFLLQSKMSVFLRTWRSRQSIQCLALDCAQSGKSESAEAETTRPERDQTNGEFNKLEGWRIRDLVFAASTEYGAR